MKVRRSERLVAITHYLEQRPYQLVPLTFFAQKYNSAKSSISEDITIIKRAFLNSHLGVVETLPGAGGGVLFTPGIDHQTAESYLFDLKALLADPKRILPGGYLYLSDMLGNPATLKKIGQLIATQYAGQKIDAIMTMATKGIPIAHSVAYYLNVPFVIVRRESKVTEGPTLSVNYASDSSNYVEKMELSKRSLSLGSRVLAVDDFMKGGGTVSGMQNLVQEFEGQLIGVTVLVEAKSPNDDLTKKMTTSLLNVQDLTTSSQVINVSMGNYLQRTDFARFETKD
ncbi:pur operon repressor [Bombilactobacillus folatiphilus]|uniref:Pur operon repressor n=1 Tax=Bombilactobacillus folatiphilus TaxID=2923362 RepID=A0ABY4P9F6_9LACO|nr:pur operon repressor [Bombilactobacillus folatiphilus]UQS82307.1 pur operon repressor [Bombilactobacillus folatiphilus]